MTSTSRVLPEFPFFHDDPHLVSVNSKDMPVGHLYWYQVDISKVTVCNPGLGYIYLGYSHDTQIVPLHVYSISLCAIGDFDSGNPIEPALVLDMEVREHREFVSLISVFNDILREYAEKSEVLLEKRIPDNDNVSSIEVIYGKTKTPLAIGNITVSVCVHKLIETCVLARRPCVNTFWK